MGRVHTLPRPPCWWRGRRSWVVHLGRYFDVVIIQGRPTSALPRALLFFEHLPETWGEFGVGQRRIVQLVPKCSPGRGCPEACNATSPDVYDHSDVLDAPTPHVRVDPPSAAKNALPKIEVPADDYGDLLGTGTASDIHYLRLSAKQLEASSQEIHGMPTYFLIPSTFQSAAPLRRLTRHTSA